MNSNRRLFLKQAGMTAMGAGLLAHFPIELYGESPVKFSLPRSSPEKQGTSSSGILTFLEGIEKSKIEFHSIMIVRHGQVIAEGWWAPYVSTAKHTLYSLSKSFTSSAVGMAIAEKHLTLESPVISFFPNDLPAVVSANLAAMKVKHLLTMATGHAKDTIPDLRNGSVSHWAKAFLAIPVEFEPGSQFVYNTGATYILSTILQKTTSKPLLQYLKPRLFDPLGMEDIDWETNPEGINTGGYGLRLRTEDVAKFGQLYLQKGLWKPKQIIPAAWVADATASHIESHPAKVKRPKEEDDWSQGYGYQFWRCRHGAYRGDGAFGQFCVVLPEQDAVVVITGESFDLDASLDLVWSHILPAMTKGELPADTLAQGKLEEKLKRLVLDPPKLNTSSLMAEKLSGKVFTLEPNDFIAKSISFTFVDNACIFRVTHEKTEHQVIAYTNNWLITEKFKTQMLFPMNGRPEVTTSLAASITWQDDRTLIMTLRYTETAHSDRITFAFIGNKVTISFLNSVSSGNPESAEKRPTLYGMMV